MVHVGHRELKTATETKQLINGNLEVVIIKKIVTYS